MSSAGEMDEDDEDDDEEEDDEDDKDEDDDGSRPAERPGAAADATEKGVQRGMGPAGGVKRGCVALSWGQSLSKGWYGAGALRRTQQCPRAHPILP